MGSPRRCNHAQHSGACLPVSRAVSRDTLVLVAVSRGGTVWDHPDVATVLNILAFIYLSIELCLETPWFS